MENYLQTRKDIKEFENKFKSITPFGLTSYETNFLRIIEDYEGKKESFGIRKDLCKREVELTAEERKNIIKKIRLELRKCIKRSKGMIDKSRILRCKVYWESGQREDVDRIIDIFEIIMELEKIFRYRSYRATEPSLECYLILPEILELLRCARKYLNKIDYENYNYVSLYTDIEKIKEYIKQMVKLLKYDYSKLSNIVNVNSSIKEFLKTI